MGLPNPSHDTNFSGANADRKILISFVQLTTSRIGSHTWLIHTLAICVTIYTQNQLFDIRASYVSYSFGMVN